MKGRIRRMIEQIERRGGMIHIDPDMPDDLTEEFLMEILGCPDCQLGTGVRPSKFDPDEPPIDRILAGTAVPPRFDGH